MHVKGPKSLYFRFLLITIIPVILIQLITTYIFYERHWESLSRNLIDSLTGEIAMTVHAISNIPEQEQEFFVNTTTDYIGLNVKIEKNKKLDGKNNVNEKYAEILSSLKSKTGSDSYLFDNGNGWLKLDIQVGNNVVSVVFSEKRIESSSTYIFILWVICSAILLLIISTSFLRVQVRSILNLSKAAERFGKGSDLKDFKPTGAREIRAAGIAFIEMKERIKRLINSRTQMLAGVSHDLKTPLTRMNLIISMLTDKNNKEQLQSEVNEMDKMIDGYLSFAKLEKPQPFAEPAEAVNLKEFIDDLIARYKIFPNKIQADIPDNIFLHIRPEYFRRGLSNLIDNSIKYAHTLKISAQVIEENAVIIFEDDGPGIPENKLEEVFQPFYRLDESRNSETGGVGLGLSITRDIINKHGGDIKLGSSKLGGLRATIILPR